MNDYDKNLKPPYLWRRANREDPVTKKAPIMLRIEILGFPRAECSTGVLATAQEWPTGTQRLVVTPGMSKAQQKLLADENDTLLDKIRIVKQAYRTWRSQGDEPTPAQLLDLLQGKGKKAVTLVTLLDKILQQVEEAGRKESTIYNVNLARTHVLEYLKHMKRPTLLANQVDRHWCREYERYCQSQKLSGATIRDFLGLVFRALDYALDEGLLKENKTAGFKYQSKRPVADKHCLPLEELHLLLHYPFSQVSITRAAHMFYFCSFTGLSYCDYLRFAKDPVPFLHYAKDEKDNYYLGIQMQRQKNQRTDKDLSKVKEFFVPLFREARVVFFTIYRGDLPVYSSDYYWVLLRKVAGEARLSIPDLSSKDARTTFSQHSRDRYGDELARIMAGHSQEVMDTNYSAPSPKRVVEQLTLLGVKFNTTSN